MMLALSIAGFLLAALPATMFAANYRLFRRLPTFEGEPRLGVSVLIPARNEEASIVGAVESVLANEGVELELIVLDDHSEDGTAALVEGIARRDSRVRVEAAPPLPAGWCGKQHACQALAGLARHELMVWMDADVRLTPDALERIVGWMNERPEVGLLSGFPRQITGTFLERLLIPLIHFVLLGFLPLGRMRASTQAALGAGCGQLFVARRRAYERAGGHATIRASLHDGIQLPRAFRRAGIATDLFDASDAASCRMYRSGAETWEGLAKNATEGMAGAGVIFFWTAVLLGGQVMPVVVLVWAAARLIGSGFRGAMAAAVILSAGAVALSLLVRLAAAIRYRQSIATALLHPLAIVGLLAVQWHAWGRARAGKAARWKGREYGMANSRCDAAAP